MEGQNDYNAHPLVPPGIQVLIHERSNVHKTWAPRGIEVLYLGLVLEHYRCYRVYAAKTGGEKISDTIHFSPKDIPMPDRVAIEQVVEAAGALTAALKCTFPIANYARPRPDVSNQ